MLPQYNFDASNPTTARNHWASFKKYVAFQTRQGNTCVELKPMFALMPTVIAWNWFEPIMNGIQIWTA